MRGTVAKRLRKQAILSGVKDWRGIYQELKRRYKNGNR